MFDYYLTEQRSEPQPAFDEQGNEIYFMTMRKFFVDNSEMLRDFQTRSRFGQSAFEIYGALPNPEDL